MEKTCRNCINYKYCSHSYGMLLDQVECDCRDLVPIIDSYSGAPGKEISALNFDAINFMAGPHKVENKMINFDRELQKVKVEELAYLRSRWTPCESCPLVDECVKDELTCLDLWARYLKEEVK